MATLLAEDFTGSNGSAWSSGRWTQSISNGSGAAATLQNGRGRLRPGNGAFTGEIGMRSNVSSADVDFLGYATYDSTNTPYLGVTIRADSGGTLSTGYQLRMPVGLTLQVWRLDTNVELDNDSGVTYSAGVTYGVRFRIIGNNIKIRTWNASGSEPSTWQIDITNSAISTSGPIVLNSLSTTATGGFMEWDNITITDGSTLVQRTYTGSLTPAGALRKLITKNPFTASITTSGLLNRLKVTLRVFTGSTGVVGVMLRGVNKRLTGSTTLTGSLEKIPQRRFVGSVVTSGAFRKAAIRVISGSIATAGTLTLTALGRIFGRPGIITATARKAGDVLLRIRRFG